VYRGDSVSQFVDDYFPKIASLNVSPPPRPNRPGASIHIHDQALRIALGVGSGSRSAKRPASQTSADARTVTVREYVAWVKGDGTFGQRCAERGNELDVAAGPWITIDTRQLGRLTQRRGRHKSGSVPPTRISRPRSYTTFSNARQTFENPDSVSQQFPSYFGGTHRPSQGAERVDELRYYGLYEGLPRSPYDQFHKMDSVYHMLEDSALAEAAAGGVVDIPLAYRGTNRETKSTSPHR